MANVDIGRFGKLPEGGLNWVAPVSTTNDLIDDPPCGSVCFVEILPQKLIGGSWVFIKDEEGWFPVQFAMPNSEFVLIEQIRQTCKEYEDSGFVDPGKAMNEIRSILDRLQRTALCRNG